MAVRDAGSSAPLARVVLSGFRIDGLQVPPAALLHTQAVQGADAIDSTIACTLPCALGNQAGAWEMMVSAPGYQPRLVSLPDVRYARCQGGCPSWCDGGVRLELALTPVAP